MLCAYLNTERERESEQQKYLKVRNNFGGFVQHIRIKEIGQLFWVSVCVCVTAAFTTVFLQYFISIFCWQLFSCICYSFLFICLFVLVYISASMELSISLRVLFFTIPWKLYQPNAFEWHWKVILQLINPILFYSSFSPSLLPIQYRIVAFFSEIVHLQHWTRHNCYLHVCLSIAIEFYYCNCIWRRLCNQLLLQLQFNVRLNEQMFQYN